MKAYFLVPILAICCFVACENEEIGSSKDVNTDAIFQSYSIGYNEADSVVELLAQFRFGGKNGTTLVLDNGSNISINGQLLNVDSNTITGAFYEAHLPISTNESKYVLAFKANNGTTYTNHFGIKPLVLLNRFKNPLTQAELTLNFAGSDNNVPITISIEDTASTGLACDTTFTPKNGQMVLPADFMHRLSSGPITIHISEKQILPLQEFTKEGGQIEFYYELKQIKAILGLPQNGNSNRLVLEHPH